MVVETCSEEKELSGTSQKTSGGGKMIDGELKKLIERKEEELFWKRLDPKAVVSGETECLEGEIRILKRIYWESVAR